jgi:hypothetical protein
MLVLLVLVVLAISDAITISNSIYVLVAVIFTRSRYLRRRYWRFLMVYSAAVILVEFVWNVPNVGFADELSDDWSSLLGLRNYGKLPTGPFYCAE